MSLTHCPHGKKVDIPCLVCAKMVEIETRCYRRIAELRSALKAALNILGHPDDMTTQALWAVLERKEDNAP